MLFTLKNVVLALVLASPVLGQASMAGDSEARAKFFNEYFQAPEDALNRPIGKKIVGVRNVKTVLPGVLYRAGGPGGQRDLTDAGLKALCEAGFAKAFYLYPQGFRGERTISCTGPDGKENSIRYVQEGYLTAAEKQKVLGDIYSRVSDPSAGPALVHCWNGYHASGEIAAVSLVQFCNMPHATAAQYWMRNQNGAKMISRISKFSEFPELRLSSDLQTAVCPN